MSEAEHLLQRVETTSQELLRLIDQTLRLELLPGPPLRAPVLHALRTQITRMQQALDGTLEDRRASTPGRRASDYR